MRDFYKKSMIEKLFDFFNVLFFIFMAFVFLYPLYNTFIVSISDSYVLGYKRISFVPLGFSLEAYKMLLKSESVIRYYINTIIYAAGGTFFMLLFTSMMAYTLLFKNFSLKKIVTVLLAITMFFGGGLIPYYLLILKLELIDTIWVLILPGSITAYNVIIFRTFFSNIPISLRESAFIDGANNFTVLFKIILPLSKPLLATFALFSIVGHWNDFFSPLIFLRSSSKYPIQLLLRKILFSLEYSDFQNLGLRLDLVQQVMSTRGLKAATIIISILPILCVYPFMQKYFAKGFLVGSIKG